LTKIKTPRHYQHPVCGDAFYVEDGWGEWHGLTLIGSLLGEFIENPVSLPRIL